MFRMFVKAAFTPCYVLQLVQIFKKKKKKKRKKLAILDIGERDFNKYFYQIYIFSNFFNFL